MLRENLDSIIERYSKASDILENSCSAGGCSPLWPRFERAAINQIADSPMALPRYAIWANTVRDNIAEALNQLDMGHTEDARQRLVEAANSLSAFSEMQSLFEREES